MEAVGPEVYGEAEQRERWVDFIFSFGGFIVKDLAHHFDPPDGVAPGLVHEALVAAVAAHGVRFPLEATPSFFLFCVARDATQKSNTKEDDDEVEKEGEENEDEDQPHPLLRNVDNLLDEGLHVRQHEWHQLYVDGRIFERVDDKAELCYFQYASPIFFVSGRDTCYIKIRRDLDDGGFILSYRSIRHDDCPPHKDYVRLEFEGAHMITPLTDRKGFTYIQHADAKGRLPKAMANGPQADVMLKEIEGVRKAIRNPLQGRP